MEKKILWWNRLNLIRIRHYGDMYVAVFFDSTLTLHFFLQSRAALLTIYYLFSYVVNLPLSLSLSLQFFSFKLISYFSFVVAVVVVVAVVFVTNDKWSFVRRWYFALSHRHRRSKTKTTTTTVQQQQQQNKECNREKKEEFSLCSCGVVESLIMPSISYPIIRPISSNRPPLCFAYSFLLQNSIEMDRKDAYFLWIIFLPFAIISLSRRRVFQHILMITNMDLRSNEDFCKIVYKLK